MLTMLDKCEQEIVLATVRARAKIAFFTHDEEFESLERLDMSYGDWLEHCFNSNDHVREAVTHWRKNQQFYLDTGIDRKAKEQRDRYGEEETD